MFNECSLQIQFPHGREIDDRKYKDLLDLLNFISAKYYNFYSNLQHGRHSINVGLESDMDADEDSG